MRITSMPSSIGLKIMLTVHGNKQANHERDENHEKNEEVFDLSNEIHVYSEKCVGH